MPIAFNPDDLAAIKKEAATTPAGLTVTDINYELGNYGSEVTLELTSATDTCLYTYAFDGTSQQAGEGSEFPEALTNPELSRSALEDYLETRGRDLAHMVAHAFEKKFMALAGVLGMELSGSFQAG